MLGKLRSLSKEFNFYKENINKIIQNNNKNKINLES